MWPWTRFSPRARSRGRKASSGARDQDCPGVCQFRRHSGRDPGLEYDRINTILLKVLTAKIEYQIIKMATKSGKFGLLQ